LMLFYYGVKGMMQLFYNNIIGTTIVDILLYTPLYTPLYAESGWGGVVNKGTIAIAIEYMVEYMVHYMVH